MPKEQETPASPPPENKVPPVVEKQVKQSAPPSPKPVEGGENRETANQVEPVKKTVPEMQEPIIVQADGRKKKGPVIPEQTKQNDEPLPSEADAIFQERLRATSNWLAWAYRGGYTIQLMMLTSEDAENNLKNIFVQDEYAPIRDDMYIIRRNSPPALFVYYGMYDTLEAARQARDDMPLFLREHNPYALSIKEALKKTEE